MTADDLQSSVFGGNVIVPQEQSLRSLPVVRGPDSPDDLLCFSRGRGDKLRSVEHLEMERSGPADSSCSLIGSQSPASLYFGGPDLSGFISQSRGAVPSACCSVCSGWQLSNVETQRHVVNPELQLESRP